MNEAGKEHWQFLVALARRSGCAPEWRDGILGWRWHCGCGDLLHAFDQQCSVLTYTSAQRRRK